ncbi:MAG: hypothetical protein A2W31_04430 [Planctomycetes bacterium RBG_16_64_10]|nr:MAG: hypothetical protein A2W31_04430 [Planctomycetes bacterium RBG_16_64_10]
MTEYEIHPAASLFPMMTANEMAELKADIEKHGQQESIILYENKIIDGRNRYQICKELRREPMCVEVDETDTAFDPVAFVLSMNLHRRHLTVSQRSMIAAKAKKIYADQAKQRQHEGQQHGRDKQAGALVENLPPTKTGKARDIVGAALKVSGKSVDHATAVIKSGSPELVAAVDNGKVSVSKAAAITKLPVDARNEAVDICQHRNRLMYNQAVRHLGRFQTIILGLATEPIGVRIDKALVKKLVKELKSHIKAACPQVRPMDLRP